MTVWRELTFPTHSLRDLVLVVEDERAKVLADPLRWQILETLGDGKSIAELSRTLEVTDARVLYHVKLLAQTGVVRIKEDDNGPQAQRCLPAAGKIRVALSAGDGAESIPSTVVSQFDQALREVAEGLYGPTFQVSVNHNRARLSETQASEFNSRLLALIEEYFPPGKGDRSGVKYGFYGILTPIDLHPLADSEPEE